MDIDSLFKVPKVPIGGNKRRMPDNPTPELLKKMKLDIPTSENGVGDTTSEPAITSRAKGKGRAVTVEDVEDGEDMDVTPDFAPGGDADYFTEEDDEGRFFGGGLTSEQKEILSIFESASGEGVQEDSEELSITAIRRMLLRFERAVNKNQDLRSKYPDDPAKFIDSEADLDSAIKALLPLAQAPVLAYPELVRSGTVALLVGLLAHENADIVIDVVELVHELTDEDVGNEAEDEETEETAEEALKILITGLLDNSILELLVDNLPRLNEAEESDRQGVFHILGIFENILGFNPQLSTQLVDKTTILTWLLNRIQSKTHEENRSYAAEILSILLQDNQKNRLEFGRKDGVESLLKTLAQYRRRDPVDADETEFMENVFDTLCSALNEPSIKALFAAAEGTDLMVLMMKEKLQSKSRAIKVLDYAMSGVTGSSICETFIEILGLKTLFSAFMGKVSKKQKAILPASEDTAHILGIISSLFSNIPSDSPARIRLLTKFVESNYEKVDKLLEIRDSARTRLKTTDSEITKEKEELTQDGEDAGELEASWYLRRLDGGLFTLQTVDYILAWIIMEDDGIRNHALQMLDRKNQSLQDIVQTLKVFRSNVDEATEPTEVDDSNRSPSQKDILEGLIAALDTSNV
ncbi:Beta-catenin-like protein 1 [Hypsizygus marmoreus]|uniref:Beta-catenin-like protein 1 n=1 Tax=Hypsizygus marmoreus TaxID=39966 RepID=A0A369JMB3_HYPMA|nr:Beta-catenin-like protein 1 [Hypsizygus marmoreus]